MTSVDVGFLLDHAGNRLTVESLAIARKVHDADPDVVNYGIRQCGFVFIRRVRQTIFVELDASSVAPLAALEAFHTVKQATAEGLVLSCPGNSWRRPVYELLSRPRALEKMRQVARMAGKRAAIALEMQTSAPLRKGDLL